MKLNYSYINSNNTKINLYITTKENFINNENEIIKEFINQLESDKIQIFEDSYNGNLYACDNYIFNTTYEFNNLQFICTYAENDKIIQCDIIFNLTNTHQMHKFNKERYYRAKAILDAI